MAKRELKGEAPPRLPYAVLNAKVGTKFIGKFLGQTKGKHGPIYQFAIQDGDAPIRIKTGKEKHQFEEVDVKPGDHINVYGSHQIDEKMALAQTGEMIEFIFNGKVYNDNTGREFNDVTVNVIE